ncbi:MAG TPA: c-type cytochrome [Thermoanaerobaculia bacterium]
MRTLIAVALALAAVSAQAEQKNVQILTNMSDYELQRTMNMMRASLGVHCDFCHVVNKETGWDFASDEKKEKKTTREMMAMVIKLNKEQFGGRTQIGCNTCHRGAINPKALVTLPQTPPPFPTPKPERPELPALADVVKKYAAAVGDAAKWESRTERGTREDSAGKSAPIALEETTDKWRVEGETPFGKMTQVVAGENGWMRGEKGLQQMKPGDVARFRDVAAAYVPTPPSAIPQDARVLSKEKVGDRDTVVVGTRAGTTRQRLYFDAASGLLVRRLVVYDSIVGPVPQQTDFDDWRDVGGAKYPFYVRTSFVDPWNSATRRYTEVKLGAVDAGAFAEPR